MNNVLKISYDKASNFCTLIHPYNKRFIDFLKFDVKPQSYRRYDPNNRKWSVHLSRLIPVVIAGKSYFDHIDYRSLPSDFQIKLVAEMKSKASGLPKFSVINSDPYSILFVLPGAPWEVIRAAYKVLASKCHPDHGGSQEDFVRIQKAYETLLKKHMVESEID
jgi:hypothetical protein